MTFIQIPQRELRLQRSMLSVPGISQKMMNKALQTDADYIMFDCEDSVADQDKPRRGKHHLCVAKYGMAAVEEIKDGPREWFGYAIYVS